MMHGLGPSAGGWLFGVSGFLGTLLVLAAISLLVVYMVKRAKGQEFRFGSIFDRLARGGRQPLPRPSLDVLDERLARGEIEVEDYLTRKAALLGGEGSMSDEWTAQRPAAPFAQVPPSAPASKNGSSRSQDPPGDA